MAMSTSCCLNLSPRPPTSSPLSKHVNKSQLARPRREIFWRNQCILGGIACVIMSLQTGNLIRNEETAMAENMQSIATSKEMVKMRWSDKRTCPPWQLNSLETIVPENLPRPSFHRKLEAAGFSKIAPPIKVTARITSNCFSM